jgi:hypothetical protein
LAILRSLAGVSQRIARLLFERIGLLAGLEGQRIAAERGRECVVLAAGLEGAF